MKPTRKGTAKASIRSEEAFEGEPGGKDGHSPRINHDAAEKDDPRHRADDVPVDAGEDSLP